jgi:hypothetical protein
VLDFLIVYLISQVVGRNYSVFLKRLLNLFFPQHGGKFDAKGDLVDLETKEKLKEMIVSLKISTLRLQD